jgi:hypothetical protein
MEVRAPHSHLQLLLMTFPLILATLDFFPKEENTGSGCLMWAALSSCLAGLYFMRAQDWAPVVAGVLFAIYFWAHSKPTGRPYQFMSAGSLLAGVLSLRFPWPNEQRCLLTLVGVGATAILQGAWIIIRYLQGDRPAEFLCPDDSANKSSDRGLLRFLHLIIGPIEHVQVFSPELESRIRARFQSEFRQLSDLEFDYLFSDGETFSIFRLVLILPAINVLLMWLKREVISLRDGCTFLIGFPVFISRNKNAFGYSSGLGVKFYTAFQDGTILVSKDYADGDIPSGPMIVKYAQKASISDTWAKHQERIVALEAEGKRVDRQTSFPVYAEISHKETAAW